VGREAGLSGPLWAFYGLGFVGLVLHSLERAMLNPFLFFFSQINYKSITFTYAT